MPEALVSIGKNRRTRGAMELRAACCLRCAGRLFLLEPFHIMRCSRATIYFDAEPIVLFCAAPSKWRARDPLFPALAWSRQPATEQQCGLGLGVLLSLYLSPPGTVV